MPVLPESKLTSVRTVGESAGSWILVAEMRVPASRILRTASPGAACSTTTRAVTRLAGGASAASSTSVSWASPGRVAGPNPMVCTGTPWLASSEVSSGESRSLSAPSESTTTAASGVPLKLESTVSVAAIRWVLVSSATSSPTDSTRAAEVSKPNTATSASSLKRFQQFFPDQCPGSAQPGSRCFVCRIREGHAAGSIDQDGDVVGTRLQSGGLQARSGQQANHADYQCPLHQTHGGLLPPAPIPRALACDHAHREGDQDHGCADIPPEGIRDIGEDQPAGLIGGARIGQEELPHGASGSTHR